MSADRSAVVAKKQERLLNAHEVPLNEPAEYPITLVEQAIRSIRFGTVQIVIQDGHIVQIDKTEKIRLR